MIRSRDLNQELKNLEVKLLKAESAIKQKKQQDDITVVEVVKIGVLCAKVLRDIRTNQVSWMKQEYGDKVFIKARRPNKPGEKPKKVEEKKK